MTTTLPTVTLALVWEDFLTLEEVLLASPSTFQAVSRDRLLRWWDATTGRDLAARAGLPPLLSSGVS